MHHRYMANARRYKMIRVPQDEYEELLRARRELVRKGLDKLPAEMQENEDDEDDDDGGAALTWGVVLGLGAAALIYLLSRDKAKGGEK